MNTTITRLDLDWIHLPSRPFPVAALSMFVFRKKERGISVVVVGRIPSPASPDSTNMPGFKARGIASERAEVVVTQLGNSVFTKKH